MLFQVTLAQTYALGRDLDQLVVFDEFDAILQGQVDGRGDLDRILFAADTEVRQLLGAVALTTRSLSRLWMPTIMPS